MSSRSLGLYVPGLRAVDPLQSSDPAVFAQQCAAVGSVVSNDGGIPHCVIPRASIANDPEGLNHFADQLPPGFNVNAPAIPGAVSVASYQANPSKGGCPVIDPSRNLCAFGSGDVIGCSELIECDWLTNANHSPAPLVGGGYANPNPATNGTPNPILAAAPSAGINQNVMSAITQPSGSSGNPAPSPVPGPSASASSSSNASVSAFLQGQAVGSIPNWVLIGGAAAIILFFMVKK